MRIITHDSTGFSPVELVHGKILRMLHALVYENWLEKDSINQIVVGCVLNLINMLKISHEPAGRRMT